jgi:hypothetical protein
MSEAIVLADTLRRKLLELEGELAPNSLPNLWYPEPLQGLDNAAKLPSTRAFSLIEQIRTDLKAIEALITPNHFKLYELGNLSFKVAALNTAVSLNVAGALNELGGEASLSELAIKINANGHKLGIAT